MMVVWNHGICANEYKKILELSRCLKNRVTILDFWFP